MSLVTNLLLHIGLLDSNPVNGAIVRVNEYFSQQGKTGLVGLDDPSLPKAWYGGSKFLEAQLYVGAFNFLDLQGFLSHLRGLDWKEPGVVQVIVMEQEDDIFRIIPIFQADQEAA